MGNKELNSCQKIDEYLPYKPKNEVKFQNDLLKGEKISPLNKSIINDISSPPDKLNNENNNNINVLLYK